MVIVKKKIIKRREMSCNLRPSLELPYLTYAASALLMVTFTFLKLISPLETLHIYSLLQKDSANKTFFLLF